MIGQYVRTPLKWRVASKVLKHCMSSSSHTVNLSPFRNTLGNYRSISVCVCLFACVFVCVCVCLCVCACGVVCECVVSECV